MARVYQELERWQLSVERGRNRERERESSEGAVRALRTGSDQISPRFRVFRLLTLQGTQWVCEPWLK